MSFFFFAGCLDEGRIVPPPQCTTVRAALLALIFVSSSYKKTPLERMYALLFSLHIFSRSVVSSYPPQKTKIILTFTRRKIQAGRRRRGRGQGQGGCRGCRERSRLQQRYPRLSGHCPGRRRRRRRRCPCERGKFKVRPSLSLSSFSRTVLGSTVLVLYYRTTHTVGHVSLITKKYLNLLFT